jgi:hypothetical protein
MFLRVRFVFWLAGNMYGRFAIIIERWICDTVIKLTGGFFFLKKKIEKSSKLADRMSEFTN